MTQTFLDDYDYRIWHTSGGITFYKDVSCENMTRCCWLLHTLADYDLARGVVYTNQGLQVAPTGTEEWEEFTFTDGTTIKHQMNTVNTQLELL
jgi:hypothetical protein